MEKPWVPKSPPGKFSRTPDETVCAEDTKSYRVKPLRPRESVIAASNTHPN